MLRIAIFVLGSTILFTPNAFASCDEDIHNYCNDVYENGGNVLACLNSHIVTPSCRQDLGAINGSFKAMMKNCQKEFMKYCDKPTSRHPKPFPECLTENISGAYQACRQKIRAYQMSMESVLGYGFKSKIDTTTDQGYHFKYNAKNCLNLLAVLPIMANAEIRKFVTESQKLYQPIDLPKMLDKIETLAKAGVADASFTMGALLQAGPKYCMARDEKMAMRFYKKAADQGNTRAKKLMKSIGD